MRKGKYTRRKGVGAKTVVMLLAVVLLLGISVGGTLAWLTAKTNPVKNVFTPSNIDVTLTETWNTDTNSDGKNDSWSAQMIPGYSYKKDPTVTVSDGSVDCYLFVKFEENNSASTYLTYTSTLTEANGWTKGDGTDIPANVWYRKVKTTDTTKSWHLLADDTLSVKDSVTKENMNTAAGAELVYTAYASQLYKSAGEEFTPAEAWQKINPTP